MDIKKEYSRFIFRENLPGSNKASSYLRALDLLSQILAKPSSIYPTPVNFWEIDSIEEITRLYQIALKHQKMEGSDFLQKNLPPSYGRNVYYSAALKSYGEFLVQFHHNKHLWSLFEKTKQPQKFAEIAEKVKIDNNALLLLNVLDYQTKEGKNTLHEIQTRVNQNFFRIMILKIYGTQCAVTGLNIPEILRASHIIPWSKDEKNRLNPCNGMCLSATYDAAFDKHLISFDDDYRMILSPTLNEYTTNNAFQKYFKEFEGKKIGLPEKFLPDKNFLRQHRAELT